MLWLILGAAGPVRADLGGSARAFERASVTTIKSLLAWIAALGGLALALLLILTGRGGIALGALVMFGPLLWRQMVSRPARAGLARRRRRRPPPQPARRR